MSDALFQEVMGLAKRLVVPGAGKRSQVEIARSLTEILGAEVGRRMERARLMELLKDGREATDDR